MNTQRTTPLLRRVCAKLRRNGVSSQLARRAFASLAILIAAENLAEAGSSRTERSIELMSSALLASRLWLSFRCAVSGSQFTCGWLDLASARFERSGRTRDAGWYL